MDKYIFDESNGLWYELQGDYYIPCLILSEEETQPMGFKQNDIGKSLSILSGGEIMKLLLAKMLMGRYNILLMDEPSNFLDIPSLEALEILMKEYAGTIMFITHDKRLLENVADVIYEIKDKKLNLVR